MSSFRSLFSKPFFTCEGVAAVFLAVLCLACFYCALCPNGWIFRLGCLGVCYSRLLTPAWLEFISARVVLALCALLSQKLAQTPYSLPGICLHSWTCVRARSRSPGSCTRLCAVIYLCEGQGVARAAWLGSARAGQFRWEGSLGGSFGPVIVQGRARGRSVTPGWAGVAAFVSRTLSTNFYSPKKTEVEL